MKRIMPLAAVALLGLTACNPINPPAPVAKNPDNLVVYVGFRITNAQVEPIFGVVHVVIDARNDAGTNLGPNHIGTNINNQDKNPLYGKNNDDGSWSYPIGIDKGAGAITVSIRVDYLADPDEILSCYISTDSRGLGTVLDDKFVQTHFKTLVTVNCGTVITN